MNSSLRRYLYSLSQGGLVLALAACSSSKSSVQSGSGSSSGSGMSSGSGATTGSSGTSGTSSGGLHDGTGMACPMMTTMQTAAKLTLQSNWPAALAVSMGSGPVTIYLLSTYTIDSSNHITGTTKTCGNQTPPITLNATGANAVGAPMGATAQVQVVLPPMVWNAPGMPVTPITGGIGGWHQGYDFEIDPSVTLDGLKAASGLGDAGAPWPQQGMQIDPGNITDDDGDGHPGITGLPRGDGGFYLPHVGTDPTTPAADQLYLVLRTALSLQGMSTSCTEMKGSANVTLLNNHVIGCRHANDQSNCSDTDWQFIDSNTTVYMVMSGTFDAQVLQGDGGATCDDVLAQTYSN